MEGRAKAVIFLLLFFCFLFFGFLFVFFYNRVRSSGELLPSSPSGISSAGSILISGPKAEFILPGE